MVLKPLLILIFLVGVGSSLTFPLLCHGSTEIGVKTKITTLSGDTMVLDAPISGTVELEVEGFKIDVELDKVKSLHKSGSDGKVQIITTDNTVWESNGRNLGFLEADDEFGEVKVDLDNVKELEMVGEERRAYKVNPPRWKVTSLTEHSLGFWYFFTY